MASILDGCEFEQKVDRLKRGFEQTIRMTPLLSALLPSAEGGARPKPKGAPTASKAQPQRCADKDAPLPPQDESPILSAVSVKVLNDLRAVSILDLALRRLPFGTRRRLADMIAAPDQPPESLRLAPNRAPIAETPARRVAARRTDRGLLSEACASAAVAKTLAIRTGRLISRLTTGTPTKRNSGDKSEALQRRVLQSQREAQLRLQRGLAASRAGPLRIRERDPIVIGRRSVARRGRKAPRPSLKIALHRVDASFDYNIV